MTFTISTSTASLGNSLITSVSLADDNGVVVSVGKGRTGAAVGSGRRAP
jgi:hypothetical protein